MVRFEVISLLAVAFIMFMKLHFQLAVQLSTKSFK